MPVEKRAAIFIGPEFGTVQRADLVAAARAGGSLTYSKLLERLGSEWVGVCFDFGNNVALCEDPMETLRLNVSGAGVSDGAADVGLRAGITGRCRRRQGSPRPHGW